MCADRCALGPEPGPCSKKQKRWYFDEASARCRSFSYGGCGGNKNRFTSRSRCDRRCSGEAQQHYTSRSRCDRRCSGEAQQHYTSRSRCDRRCSGEAQQHYTSRSRCDRRCSGGTATLQLPPPQVTISGSTSVMLYMVINHI